MKENKINTHNEKYNINETEDMFVCSSGDCTGLIPANPQFEDDLEAYEELYHYLPRTYNKDD